jgi:ferritin
MHKAINEQINKELYSAYLYLSMAAFFEDSNLPGFGKWLRMQAAEEQEHAMKFFDHLVERGAKVELKAIDTPTATWKSYLEVFKQVQEHEAFVTASINALYEIAQQEKDYPAQVLLHWFIKEQVEEESNAANIVNQLELVDGKGQAILMLDHAMGQR